MENKEKPTWLQILEAESWQAEMLVSGAAIYGSLLLPDLIRQLIDMALLWLPEGALSICYFIFWYLTICASVLIISFILHFVLRALWIGMIGLVSVFPEGINRDTDYHSEHFLKQLFEEFPDVNDFNRRLDDFCSLMFGITFGVVIMIIAVCILISFCLILSLILASFLPFTISTVFLILILLFLVPTMFSGLLNNKSLRDKKWVQRIHFTMAIKIFGRIMYNVFYEPGYYILYILLTNFKRNRMGIWVIVGIFLIMVISLPVFMNSNVGLLRQKAFFEMAETDHRIYVDNYEDQMTPGRAVFAPLLPSDVISGSVMRVFIPMSRREKVLINEYCGAYKEDKSLSRRENNRRRRNQFKDCRVNYYELYVNDNKLDSLEFFRHTHPNAGEEGLLTYIPSQHFQEGVNRLRIVHLYQNESGEKKESVVPFWFSGSN
ncbi:MAG: hypothetical protein F6K19_15740 [Cyanothece sp. SIO1E1]|nr:hypothetical protein [Cyanothece sp. SIO1E1]